MEKQPVIVDWKGQTLDCTPEEAKIIWLLVQKSLASCKEKSQPEWMLAHCKVGARPNIGDNFFKRCACNDTQSCEECEGYLLTIMDISDTERG